MARALRLEYSGALYHVTSRGDIYDDDADRIAFIELLDDICESHKERGQVLPFASAGLTC